MDHQHERFTVVSNDGDALPTVSVDEAAAADTAGAVLLDVREYDEWMSGHAPTAIHIPMNDLPARVGELDRTKRVVCICRSGNRSGHVTAWLLRQGFDAVNLSGGMFQWASCGHPMVNHAGNAGVVI